MRDLVDRLRSFAGGVPSPDVTLTLLSGRSFALKAADEIASLRARVAELEEALRPFTEDDEHGIHRIEGWEWRQRHPRWKEDARRALGMKVEP